MARYLQNIKPLEVKSEYSNIPVEFYQNMLNTQQQRYDATLSGIMKQADEISSSNAYNPVEKELMLKNFKDRINKTAEMYQGDLSKASKDIVGEIVSEKSNPWYAINSRLLELRKEQDELNKASLASGKPLLQFKTLPKGAFNYDEQGTNLGTFVDYKDLGLDTPVKLDYDTEADKKWQYLLHTEEGAGGTNAVPTKDKDGNLVTTSSRWKGIPGGVKGRITRDLDRVFNEYKASTEYQQQHRALTEGIDLETGVRKNPKLSAKDAEKNIKDWFEGVGRKYEHLETDYDKKLVDLDGDGSGRGRGSDYTNPPPYNPQVTLGFPLPNSTDVINRAENVSKLLDENNKIKLITPSGEDLSGSIYDAKGMLKDLTKYGERGRGEGELYTLRKDELSKARRFVEGSDKLNDRELGKIWSKAISNQSKYNFTKGEIPSGELAKKIIDNIVSTGNKSATRNIIKDNEVQTIPDKLGGEEGFGETGFMIDANGDPVVYKKGDIMLQGKKKGEGFISYKIPSGNDINFATAKGSALASRTLSPVVVGADNTNKLVTIGYSKAHEILSNPAEGLKSGITSFAITEPKISLLKGQPQVKTETRLYSLDRNLGKYVEKPYVETDLQGNPISVKVDSRGNILPMTKNETMKLSMNNFMKNFKMGQEQTNQFN